MAQINLLDSDKKPSFHVRSYSWLTKVMGVVLILVLAFYGYQFVRQRSLQNQINSTRTKITDAQKEASDNTTRKELLTRQGQLNALNPILASHLRWSGLLPELARVTVQRSNYISLDASGDGGLILSVKFPTYADADKFLQVFDLPAYNKQFNDVRVLSITKSDDNGAPAYLMRVQLNFVTDFLKPTTSPNSNSNSNQQ